MAIITINTFKDSLKPAPPFLIFASLLLWGWQTNYLLYAIIMGVLLELPLFIKWRIDFSDKDVNQLADLSGVLFFIVTVYVFVNYSFHGIFKILGLLPFSLFLLMLTQRYSIRNSIKTSALFISVRRLGENAGKDILYEVDISLPYIFICLISASAGNKFSDLFFIISTLLIVWMLWSFRPKHFPLYSWLLPVTFVIGISYITQIGIQQLQESAESFFLDLFEQYGWKSRDPERTMTAIGSIGRLKLSDRIVLRIKSDNKLNTPLYFRETSYSIYEYGTWRNPKIEFDIIQKVPTKNEWHINEGNKDTGEMNINLYLDNQSAIIPVPDNINSLAGKDLIQVETSVYGATRIEAREGWINYRLGYADIKFKETTPDPEDLMVPVNYQEDFRKVATDLGLDTKSPDEIIHTVKQYFKDNFFYSVTQNQRYTKGGYLSKFLFESKKGHCEYFATATALLLREAGIPTRYTIGYSVQEYSPWQGLYIVRARHAHSWIEYYMNDEWHLMDTTPSVWAPLEAEDQTFLEPLIDLFSWLRYKITSSEIDDKKENSDWLIWLLIPLGTYLAWRFYKKQRVEQTKKKQSVISGIIRYGTDSPVYALLAKLEKQADARRPGETLTEWIKRILPVEKTDLYIELIKQHYQYRFNPKSDKQKDISSIHRSLKRIMEH